jgi:MFS family permease
MKILIHVNIAIGVFQEYYETDLLSSYSASTISWIVSLETFFMFVGAPFVGNIYDNFGPRWLLLGGTFLHVFGLMVSPLS